MDAHRLRRKVIIKRRALRSVLHMVLLMGCAVFSFPFVWLISTTLKFDKEIFVYPPKWIPDPPYKVVASPYIGSREYYYMLPPVGFPKSLWVQVKDRVKEAIWREASKYIDYSDIDKSQLPILKKQVVYGLWESIRLKVPEEAWRNPEGISKTVADALLEEDVRNVWGTVRKALLVGEFFVEDKEGREFNLLELAKYKELPTVWVPEGTLKVVPTKEIRTGKPCYEFRYYFGNGSNSCKAEAFFALPFEDKQLRGFTIPIRADISFHKIWIWLITNDGVYKSTKPVYLLSDNWQDISCRFADDPLLRDEDIPLQKVGVNKRTLPGTIKVILELERTPYYAALFKKFTYNYSEVTRYVPFWRFTANSFFLVIMNVLGQIISCSMVGYAFSRLRWPGRDILFGIMISTMMLPGQVTMIPVFVIFKKLGWYNTMKPLWVPAFFGSAFFIFLVRQFLLSIPQDLEDAAKIDGCSYFRIYWNIMLPLIKPTLATIAIFTFMGSWNNFMGPLIYINKLELTPLSLGLFVLRTAHGGEWGMMMAASTMMTLPVIIVFFFAQKYFIQGVTLTGMKG